MSKDHVVMYLRRFHYDPEWRVMRRGKKPMHVVPMRALGKVSGVSYVQIYRAIIHGWLSDNACLKLEPFIKKILSGDGRFVYIAKTGYVFEDDTLKRLSK